MVNYECAFSPSESGKYFEWIIRRILQISEGVILSTSADNTLLDLQNSSHPTQPRSIIAKCISRLRFFRLYTSTCVKIANCVSPCSHVEIFMLFQKRMRDFLGSKCYRFRVGRGAIINDWKKTPSQWRVFERYYRQTSDLRKVKCFLYFSFQVAWQWILISIFWIS